MQDFWWKNAVIYQIYPLSYKDTNGDGFGDLPGIIEKLDHLSSMKVDAIWLSPIYRSPMADWGYDVSDHYDIDHKFGEMKDLEKLLEGAHKRGMKVILDYVPNHTSNKHPWFIESKKGKESIKRDWYIWKDPKPDGSPPNNWISVFGGPAWTMDDNTGQYYLHSFLPEQPDLNWRNQEVVSEMKKVLNFWMDKGVDGFRVDALSHLMKDRKFRDEPPNPDYTPEEDNPYNALVHVYSRGQEDLVPQVNNLCSVLEGEKGRFMVGEMATLTPKEMVKFQKICSDELHLPFNFNLFELEWDAASYKQFIDSYEYILGNKYTPNWVLGNHDQPRVASRIGMDNAKVAAMLTMTLGGTAFIYYGEEIGMENTKIKKDEVQDPWEKRVPDMGLGRDPERTPMQWSSGKMAGFTDGKPWLPVNENYKKVNVEKQEKNDRSILHLYRQLIHLRKENKALKKGKYLPVNTSDKDVFAFARQAGEDKVFMVLNFSEGKVKVSVGEEGKKVKQLLSTHMDNKGKLRDTKSIELKGSEGVILQDTNAS